MSWLIRAEGKPLTAVWATLGDATIAEIVRSAGVDLLLVDLEHSTLDLEGVQAYARAAESSGLPILVRTPTIDASWIARIADIGVDGIIVPHITSVDAAQAAVAAAKFPPLGDRGLSQSARWVRRQAADTPIEARMQHANDRLALVVMIEEESAAEAVDEIAAVPGIDALHIGLNDLRRSIGADRVSLTVERVAQVAQEFNKALGIPVGHPACNLSIEEAAGLGATYVTVGVDTGLFAQGLASALPRNLPTE